MLGKKSPSFPAQNCALPLIPATTAAAQDRRQPASKHRKRKLADFVTSQGSCYILCMNELRKNSPSFPFPPKLAPFLFSPAVLLLQSETRLATLSEHGVGRAGKEGSWRRRQGAVLPGWGRTIWRTTAFVPFFSSSSLLSLPAICVVFIFSLIPLSLCLFKKILSSLLCLSSTVFVWTPPSVVLFSVYF